MKKFLIALFKDIIDQAWTLLGMAVAWLVLEGSAKQLTGNLILITLAVWVITFPLRYEKEEEEPKDGDKDGYVHDGTPKQRKATPKKKNG
jgi:hypothetical protein